MSDIVERVEERIRYEPTLKTLQVLQDSVAEITRLRAELADLQQTNAEQATIILDYDQQLAEARGKALDEAAEAVENLSFFTDVSDLIGMTKQGMSERTCHEAAQAIRALKSPKPPIL